MERRRGVVVRSEEPPALADRPETRRRVSAAMVDALVNLHAIDVNRADLSALGKPAGFVERQVRGWTDRWNKSKTSEIPEMEALAGWLRQQMPPDPDRPTVVHGDFKLDNRSEPLEHRDALTSITDRPGWFTRGEIVERYGRCSGRDLSRIHFYETFALFKIAVVIQQIFGRYARGQTDDPRFAHFDVRVAHLARQAAALAERA
jgi:aminoglycoside phosphotransferase (APT) family kinase protein